MNLLISKIIRWKMLILLNAVYAAAGLLWIILIPYNNAPDENTHFRYSVEFIMQHRRLPVWGVDDLERFRHALSSYNQTPALNYVLYAAGARLANKLFGLETYLGARLVSLGWGLLFLNFLFWAVRALCGHNKNALIVSAAGALIPQVFFSFCYVNGDAHSLAIAALLGLALVRFFRAQTMDEFGFQCPKITAGRAEAGPGTTTPTAKPKFPDLNIIFLGAAIGMLFSAKYNYYIYFPCIALIIIRAALRRAISWRTVGELIIVSGVLSLLISGFWFIRNWKLYSNPLPLFLSEDFFKSIALARDVHPVNRGLNIPALVWLVQNGFIGTSFNSFFAVFGYLNVGFRREIYIILQFIIPLIAFLFILDLMATRDRVARVMLGWLILMVFAVMAMHVWGCLTYDYQPQGRYQFPILVPSALYAGWVITRQVSLWKHAVFFLIMMIWLFIGANILIVRTYASPVQFSVFWPGPDQPRETLAGLGPTRGKSFTPSKCVTQKAKRIQENFYAAENIFLDHESSGLRIDLPEGFLARYRDFKVEFDTNDGLVTADWTSTPPERLVNVKFDKKLNAFETCGAHPCFILPLKDKAFGANSVRIGCRIENRRLYDLGE